MVSHFDNDSTVTLTDLISLLQGIGGVQVVAGPGGPPADPATLLTGDASFGADRIGAVKHDSRTVLPGDLYVGLPGSRVHGARFCAQIAAAGAVAMLTDRAGAELAAEVLRTGPASGTATEAAPDAGNRPLTLVVNDPRRAMAEAAALVNRRPAEQMLTFAVTGTNGKTTTTFMLDAILRHLGRSVGTIGTIGFLHDGVPLEFARTTVTTPESSELQALLATFVRRGADALAMEVSSHAMALHRADAVVFDVAGFANLGRDHLDFHHTMADYFEAKAALFTPEHARAAVINIDDEWGRQLAARVAEEGRLPLLTTGWQNHGADYRVLSGEDQQVRLATPHGELEFTVGLPGDFNVRNAATALAMTDLAGLDVSAAAEGLAKVQVPGRMQDVPLADGGRDRAPRAVVDFAHTPQAVASALEALAPLRQRGRLVTVVGCGGDRDITKRGPMGAAAAAGSDLVVVTDDNPRTEDPAAIRAATLAGAQEHLAAQGRPAAEAVDGRDRRSAINLALREAGPTGTVAVLGKGHEVGQEVGGVVSPFDDVAVIGEEWSVITSGERGERVSESSHHEPGHHEPSTHGESNQ